MARIWIHEDFNELMDELSPSGKEQTFENFAHAAAFCAALAFNKKGILKKEYKVKGSSPSREIRDNVLDGQDLKEQIDILALAHTGSHEILKDEEEIKDERYKIFQNYANTGLKFLSDIKEKKATDTSGVDTVIQILSEISAENVSDLEDSEIGEIPVDYRGRNLKLPGKRTYGDWEITMLADGEFQLRNAFERWMNDLNDAVENVADQEHNLNNVLFPNWSIDQLDRTGKPLKTYTMFHCWPKSVSAMENSYDNETLAEFSVTLAYSYFLTNDGTGSNRVPLGDAAFPGE